MASTTSIKAITNIRNAAIAKLGHTAVGYSLMNIQILNILIKENVIQGFQIKGSDIIVSLLNSEVARQKLKNISSISKPSKQVYARLKVLKYVNSKLGSSISHLTLISTNLGIVTVEEAVREGLGGEVLFAANPFVVEAMALAN